MTIDRHAIYERDQGLCGFCGKPVPSNRFHIDHIMPRAMAGSSEPSNLRVAHVRCNIAAGAQATVGPRRPSKAAESLTVFNARIPSDIVRRVRRVADEQDRSLNAQVVRAMREWLENYQSDSSSAKDEK